MTFLAVLGLLWMSALLVAGLWFLATAIVDRLFAPGKPNLRIER